MSGIAVLGGNTGQALDFTATGVTTERARIGTEIADELSVFASDLTSVCFIRNVRDPEIAQDAATKAYVDNLANGIAWKGPCLVSGVVDVPDLNNPGSSFDGETVTVVGTRILLLAQSTGSENGIWEWQGAASAMTRPSDFANGSPQLNAATFVATGSTNADKAFVSTADPPNNIVDTNDPLFIQFTTTVTGPATPLSSVQFNNGGVFGGVSGVTSDGTAVLHFADNAEAQFGNTLGSEDFSILHNGTDTLLTNTQGNLVLDNEFATGATVMQLGTDTAATSFQVQNDTGTAQFTVDASGQADFVGNVDASGGVDIDADNQSLTIGAGADFSILHNGTNTLATSAVGDFVLDNTNATGSTIIQLGTDDDATDFQVQNDTGTAALTVYGSSETVTAGDVTIQGALATSVDNTEDTTAGPSTYTAAIIKQGLVRRDGGLVDRADILPLATDIIAAIKDFDDVAGDGVGSSFLFTVMNTGATNTITVGGNTGTTVEGTSVLQPGENREFRAVVATGTTVVVYSLTSNGVGASTSPAAPDFSLQFNDSFGAFGGSSTLTFNGTDTMTVGAEATTFTFQGTDASSLNTNGTQVRIDTGSGNGTGDGGLLNITAGNGGNTGDGGGFIFTSGNGGLTSGNGGNVLFQSGGPTTAGFSGDVVVQSGTTIGAASSGPTSLRTGEAFGSGNTGALSLNSGDSATGASGQVSLLSGTSGGNSGTVLIATGGSDLDVGDINITGGNSSTANNGGSINLTAGTTTGGTAGTMTFTAGEDATNVAFDFTNTNSDAIVDILAAEQASTTTTTGTMRVTGGLGVTGQVSAASLAVEDSGNYTTIDTAATGDWTLTLPADGGTADFVLQTNGSGTTTWVDPSSFAGALSWKERVIVATTAELAALSGLLTIDGYTLLDGDRVLVKDGTTANPNASDASVDNGIYAAAAGAWSRVSDLAAADDASAVVVAVNQGTVNGDTLYICATDFSNAEVGSDALEFQQVSAAPGEPSNSIQFNNGGSFGGSSQLTYNGTDTMTLGDDSTTFTIEGQVADGGAGTAGANVIVAAGAGTGSTSDGGDLTLNAGSIDGTSGVPGGVTINAGDNGSDGNGGAVAINAGDAGTNSNGGDITITAGALNGTGADGTVTITSGGTPENSTSVGTGVLRVVGGLGVSQDAYAQTFNAVSDARLKTNIQPIDDALNKIMELEGYTYKWKDESMGTAPQMGILAQEAERVPGLEAVVTGTDDRKAVNYSAIIGLLIAAVKEMANDLYA